MDVHTPRPPPAPVGEQGATRIFQRFHRKWLGSFLVVRCNILAWKARQPAAMRIASGTPPVAALKPRNVEPSSASSPRPATLMAAGLYKLMYLAFTHLVLKDASSKAIMSSAAIRVRMPADVEMRTKSPAQVT